MECQEGDHLLWVVLDHGAKAMWMAGEIYYFWTLVDRG